MAYLYEKLETLREIKSIKSVPPYVSENVNPHFLIRDYQTYALENFITYFENEQLHKGKRHVLFHMATGSGKTLVMAASILYLYGKGYRNFLFFVNLSGIVKKTIDNFLNKQSSKYLFSPSITIDGKKIAVRNVNNFSESSPHAINILFDTTAGLHSDFLFPKENAPSIEDFLNNKTVLIADEAHHLNANTKNKTELDDEHSWEVTIKKLFSSRADNVLLEFTATANIANDEIREKYEDKIIYNYPLFAFRKDKYSKDIFTLRSDFSQSDTDRIKRSLQAIILSQFRLKLFEKLKMQTKPIVLFKSKTIKESKENKTLILNAIKNIKTSDIAEIKKNATSEIMKKAFRFFKSEGLENKEIADEIKLYFSEQHTIDVNDDSELDKNQILVNSLEKDSNNYRMIFEVEKLDEGWDCLNLFDIVRLYETRDSKGNKPGKSTVREAQLIGRGARYFPFSYKDAEKDRRKFDEDLENIFCPLEQLHYHCQNDSKYIHELKNALKEIGIDDIDGETRVTRTNELKENFTESTLYKTGNVFVNKREQARFGSVNDIAAIQRAYSFDFSNNEQKEENVFIEQKETETLKTKNAQNVKTSLMSLKEIAKEKSYALVRSCFVKTSFSNYETLHTLFPDLKSVKEFLTSEKFLGDVKISLTTNGEVRLKDLKQALFRVFNTVSNVLVSKKETFIGSKEFYAIPLNEKIKTTVRNYAVNENDGEGTSQKNCSNDAFRFDVGNVDWFIFKDHFGTTEEKRFVKYFNDFCMPTLEKRYSEIKLIRNELQVGIYDFKEGRKFCPDFLLFLKNKKTNEYEYTQVFIEPKGEQLELFDEWKNVFLKELKEKAIPVVKLKTDAKYKIWGLPFYTHKESSLEGSDEFKKAMAELMKGEK